MNRRYNYRIYPTERQKRIIDNIHRICCKVYNTLYQYRLDKFRETQTCMSYKETSSYLTKMKQADKSLYRANASILQNTLRDLDDSFHTIYRYLLEKKTPMPRFRDPQAATYSFRLNNNIATIRKKNTEGKQYATQIRIEGNKIRLPGIGWVKIKLHRPYSGDITSATVLLDICGHYYVSLSCNDVKPNPLPPTGRACGVDIGIKNSMSLDTGEKYSLDVNVEDLEKKIKALEDTLILKSPGSHNYQKVQTHILKLRKKIQLRKDNRVHCQTKEVIEKHDVIAVETLSVDNMMKNTGMKNVIRGGRMAQYSRFLQYKAEDAGRELRKAAPNFPSSQRCHVCGGINAAVKDLSIRVWTCPQCGTHHDRDVNAACNILQYGR